MNKSIVLLEIIVVIVVLAIVVSGIVIYVAESLMFNISAIEQEKALYMAQASIMRGIVDYSDDNLWDSAQDANVEGEFYYHLGRDANFLEIDASAPNPNKKKLKNIPIQNINATNSITITDMVVSWTFAGKIKKVKLNNTKVWTGNTTSPASIDITDFVIDSGVSYTGKNDQQWIFSKKVTGDIIVTFIFGDGSQRKVYVLKDGSGSEKGFSVTATGEVRRGEEVKARRTLVATYDTGTSEITSWEESQSHIIP